MSPLAQVGLMLAIPLIAVVIGMVWAFRKPKPKTFSTHEEWEKYERDGGGS